MPLAPAIAPGHVRHGAMLPSTPLHHLLLREVGLPLVMTSGNRTDEPICTNNNEARERLAGVADAFSALAAPAPPDTRMRTTGSAQTAAGDALS